VISWEEEGLVRALERMAGQLGLGTRWGMKRWELECRRARGK
jgi:hypothetical protein